MNPNIFEIENGKIVINPEILTIPELRAVKEYYADPLPPLAFLYHYYKQDGAYNNVQEDEKLDLIYRDNPGDYTLEDDVLIGAMKKMEVLTTTPTYRYYLDQKYLLEKLGKFARTTTITAGKDGNINALLAQIRSTSKTINEFKNLEKMVQEELKTSSKVKGNKKIAYDQ